MSIYKLFFRTSFNQLYEVTLLRVFTLIIEVIYFQYQHNYFQYVYFLMYIIRYITSNCTKFLGIFEDSKAITTNQNRIEIKLKHM